MQPTIQIPQLPQLKSDGTFDTPAVQRFFEDIQKTLQSKQLADYSNITDLSDNLPATIKENLNASGSAPIYACRAWVSFTASTTVPVIKAKGNVGSIIDIGVGLYTIVFSVPMSDENYTVVSRAVGGSGVVEGGDNPAPRTVNSFRSITYNSTSGAPLDPYSVDFAVFR